MPSLRCLTAFVASLLLLQLTLLGADWSCGTHGRSGAHAPADMQGTPHHTSHAGDETCDTERAAGDCARMASCATQLSVPACLATAIAPTPASDALPEPVSIYSQPATSPDVPPPRG